MDVNRTRFFLYKGEGDWGRWRLANQPQAEEGWPTIGRQDHAPDWLHVAWDEATEAVTLRPQLVLFPRSPRDEPLSLSARRGSAVDQFGNWFWIGNDRLTIHWRPFNSQRARLFWSQEPPATQPVDGTFVPKSEAPFSPTPLRGLAVTKHHYLVVGYGRQEAQTPGGIFVFDLHAGGEPERLNLPEDVPFAPYDMAPAPDGGLWILDQDNLSYWGLDAAMRPRIRPWKEDEPVSAAFEPKETSSEATPAESLPSGDALWHDLGAVVVPAAIEALPDGSLLVLDVRGQGASIVHHLWPGQAIQTSLALEDEVSAIAADGSRQQQRVAVVAHDMAYDAETKTLFVVERDGNQAIAFSLALEESPAHLRLELAYLPMQNYGGRSLVAANRLIYYDLTGHNQANDANVHWTPLRPIDRRRYQRTATLTSPAMDGRERNCVWHRCFIDGCIPPETEVEVWSRAHNDQALLESVPFAREPDLYLRGGGSEIPYLQQSAATETSTQGSGSWELLLQRMNGRWGQIRLVLRGNSRATPRIQHLRAYYPRFSYARRYLPAVYLEDAESADFLERMLANMEGFYSELEGEIDQVSSLFDARSAPPDALEWLAGWFGLMMDPIWATIQERRAKDLATQENGSVNGLARVPADRRRLFVRFARRLFERRGTADGIKFALLLLLEPCLELLMKRLKAVAVGLDPAFQEELARYDLTLPTPASSSDTLEDLLYDYLLAPKRPSAVRIVERFLSRQGRALAQGDTGAANDDSSASVIAAAVDAAAVMKDAHQFAVLVPEKLSDAEAAMVQRIVKLEKPAHTLFEVRRFWDYYRVGEARLGIDTVLGQESRFLPMVLGRGYLSEGYLSASHPMNVADRFVTDRDRLWRRRPTRPCERPESRTDDRPGGP